MRSRTPGLALVPAGVAALVSAALLTGSFTASAAEQEARRPRAGGVTILDTFSSWRMFHVLKPPEIASGAGVKPIVYEQHYWLNRASAPPPADWTGPDFDDSEWLRGPALMGCQTPYVARACLRGRFRVADPARAKALRLAVSYYGGAVVYLNGEEIRRSDLPAGRADLAAPYPVEAFMTPEGAVLLSRDEEVLARARVKPTEEDFRRMAMRTRTLEVDLPAPLLRKGVNVLAVELVRAPYHQVMADKKTPGGGAHHWLVWNTCDLRKVSLSAADGDAVEPNTARPEGLHVWNASLLRGDAVLDFGDPCEPLRPIVLTGVRNGAFSGKVLTGSTEPLKGLKVSAGDLEGPAGRIPATALCVRYGAPGGTEYGLDRSAYGLASREARFPRRIDVLSVLCDAPPAEAPVQGEGGAAGAVVPIWITVTIPPEARPGVYQGTLRIECDGEKPASVPLELTVLDWTLPDAHQFKTWTDVVESPDTLQLEYGVAPWSDEHFELIARSFRFIRQTGSSMLYLPLICETNYGNAESMVRWVRKGDRGYDFDFSVMDRYLDVAEQALGKPKAVCFIVWDVFLFSKDSKVARNDMKRFQNRPAGPEVTLLDPAAGTLSKLTFPDYRTDPAAKAHWHRLFAELRARMKRRGLEHAMMVGWFSDIVPAREDFDFWREASGDLPWVSHSHFPTYDRSRVGGLVGSFKTGYMTSFFKLTFPGDPALGRTYGWKNPLLLAQNLRMAQLDRFAGTFWRSVGEINIAGDQRGFGRLGGDYWLAVKDAGGRRRGRAYDRYPWSSWGNMNVRSSLLAPGPHGALATSRLEILREGIQECEARIFLEQALTDGALRRGLGKDLCDRAQGALDERVLCIQRGLARLQMSGHYGYDAPWQWIWQTGGNGHAWFQSAGWQDRSRQLYSLAAEASERLPTR